MRLLLDAITPSISETPVDERGCVLDGVIKALKRSVASILGRSLCVLRHNKTNNFATANRRYSPNVIDDELSTPRQSSYSIPLIVTQSRGRRCTLNYSRTSSVPPLPRRSISDSEHNSEHNFTP